MIGTLVSSFPELAKTYHSRAEIVTNRTRVSGTRPTFEIALKRNRDSRELPVRWNVAITN
jgi:molybdate-binding protein